MLEKSVGKERFASGKEPVRVCVCVCVCVSVPVGGALLLRCWRDIGCDLAAAATSVVREKKRPFQIRIRVRGLLNRKIKCDKHCQAFGLGIDCFFV